MGQSTCSAAVPQLPAFSLAWLDLPSHDDRRLRNRICQLLALRRWGLCYMSSLESEC